MGNSRRRFIVASGLGALALAAGGLLYSVRPGTSSTASPEGFALAGTERAALAAIIPALLAGALAHEEKRRAAQVDEVVEAVHVAVRGLAPATQREVAQLFGLLAMGPVRRMLAGVPTDWEHASVAQVSAFLQSWREHRLGLLRSAYHALHALVLGAWYAQPASWAATGYPGPRKDLA